MKEALKKLPFFKSLKRVKCKVEYYLKCIFYPLFLLINTLRFKLFKAKILSDNEIIELIKNDKMSIARYGDGEFSMVLNNNYSIGFQRANSSLRKKLTEMLVDYDGSKFMIGIIGTLNPKSLMKYKSSVRIFWTNYIFWRYNKINKLIKPNMIYFDTQLTRCYMDYESKDGTAERYKKLKEIWNDKDLIIVEGNKTKMGIGNDLFDNVKSIKRIICPSKNAFDYYDEIFEVARRECKNKLTIIALGPTATVLAADLAKLNQDEIVYQALDLGHLDVEYEWFRMNANSKVAIIGKAVNEVSDIDNSNQTLDEEIYRSQIVYEVK